MTKYEKAGQTKRQELEQEFCGIPFERARQIRQRYYSAGYSRARETYRGEITKLRALIERQRGVIAELRARPILELYRIEPEPTTRIGQTPEWQTIRAIVMGKQD